MLVNFGHLKIQNKISIIRESFVNLYFISWILIFHSFVFRISYLCEYLTWLNSDCSMWKIEICTSDSQNMWSVNNNVFVGSFRKLQLSHILTPPIWLILSAYIIFLFLMNGDCLHYIHGLKEHCHQICSP